MLAYAYMHSMGWGWAILMTLGWLALLGLFVGVLVTTLRDRRGESPREVLDRRLAAGDIDIETYQRSLDAMSDAASGRPPASPPTPA